MDIIVSLIEGGCYSAVFAVLLLYSLKSSGKRERCYREVIVELAEGLRQMEIISGKVDRILDKCDKITEKKKGNKAVRSQQCECITQTSLPAEAL